MSRITGSEAKSLMEAYNAVYVSQELTEEQIWEEVENWVNSLLEEGYDLSDYTWEEMYEAYLSEGGAGPRASVPASATGKYKSSSDGKYYRNYNDALAARNSRLNTLRSAQDMLKGKPSSLGATPAERARPPVSARPAASAPAPRPAAPAASVRPSARPAPAPARPAPTATSTANPKTNPVKPTPTPAARPSLRSDLADLQKMGIASQMRQKGANVVSTQLAHFDPFDIIKGHLLDEGYANTEEAALAIMANMSEDWKESILDEAMSSYDRNRQRAAQRAAARNAARKEGKTGNVPGVGYVSPRPERETWTDEGGRERHTSGARMPKKD